MYGKNLNLKFQAVTYLLLYTYFKLLLIISSFIFTTSSTNLLKPCSQFFDGYCKNEFAISNRLVCALSY